MKRLVAILAILLVILAIGLVIAVRMILGGDAVRAAIEQQATAALGHPVTIDAASPRIFPRPAIDLTGVTAGANREVTLERVSLSTGLGALLGRRIEDAEFRIESSRIDVPWAMALFAALSNAPQSGLTASAAPGGVAIVSISTLTLRGVELIAGERTLRVDMDSALSGTDRLEVTRLEAQGEGSELRASGEFSSLSARTGVFKVDAETLDVDALLAFMAAMAAAPDRRGSSATAAPGSAPLKLNIDVRAKQGTVAGASFSNLAAASRIEGSDARLDDLSLDLFGGSFKGAVAVLGSGAEPPYEWRGSFEGLDAAQVAAFAGTAGSLTGRLGGSMSISAAGQDPQAAIRRARGTADVAVTDGRIPGLEIVRGVILAFGKPTGDRPVGSGEAFSRLAATLAVADQRLSTSDLTFASRDFDMTAEGNLSLASQALDFEADVVLSRELSAQAGRDLYRLAREDDRIVLPARITGTVGGPTVFIDIEEALRRAIRNRAKDELKSLFDRLKKQIIKK